MKRWTAMVAITAVALASGCATVAPNYTPNPAEAQRLQTAGAQPAKVGEFTAEKGVANTSMTLRASSMEPAQGSYANYLASALRNELELVKLFSATSPTEISGVLLKNDMNTGVAVTGEGTIEARFVVRRDGVVRFDKTKSAKSEWDTNYFGAIAIPRAQQEYPKLVQKLVATLFSDPEFQAALK